MYGDHNVLKLITSQWLHTYWLIHHMLMKQFPLVIMLHCTFEYFSCVLFFLCPLLPSCSGCTFCHPAEQAIDPETSLSSSSIQKTKQTNKPTPKNPNHLLQFKLAFLAATDYHFLHRHPVGLKGGDMAVLSQLNEKNPEPHLVSSRFLACISSPALLQY